MDRFKKVLTAIGIGLILVFAASCGGLGTPSSSSGSSAKATSGSALRVGVSMPTQASQRWIQDGANIKQKLTAMGYDVDLQYAEDDVEAQAAQVDQMLADGAKCLVIAPIQSESLQAVLQKAKAKGIPVISYDRLIMGADNVSYYVTFDSRKCGELIGRYVEQQLGLKEGKGPYDVEFFAGSVDDNNAHLLNDGVFAVLQPYLDKGQLRVPSGRTSFADISILRWLQKSARERMSETLSADYLPQGRHLDAAVSEFDGFSYGIADALLAAGYEPGSGWPLITGQDGEIRAAKGIIAGRQSMSVFKDTRILADRCVTMVRAVLEQETPELTPGAVYDNGKIEVPAYLCQPELLEKGNMQKVLIDSGYYRANDIGL
jgi:putative multiple sugar transport system substrate-binding protein